MRCGIVVNALSYFPLVFEEEMMCVPDSAAAGLVALFVSVSSKARSSF